jgi:serine/threonine-protein kinase
MADVLLGRAEGIEGFERHVVLKRIRAELAKDKRFIEMFLDEARLAATLHHQNIVQVYDIGEEGGEYFFAMEYLHGEDLRKLLGSVSKQKQNIPLANVVAIVSAAASGLHHAHDRRATDKKRLEIVHRDVSPSNIIIGYDGSVKLVDFGIAKATMRSSDTRTGTLKGKTSYMSPEQCKGESSIDRRSDVYSLGVVLYELATTTRLFKGESDYLVMDAIVNGKVPLPRVRRPDLPNELSSIIMRALAVDPNRRFQTADELRLALEQFALNANLAASTSAIATYMKKLFGEKTEPWIDTARFDRVADGRSSRNSWSDISRSSEDLAPSDQPTRSLSRSTVPPGSGSHAALSGSGSHATIQSPSSPSIGRTTTGSRAIRETRTSTRMAWEHQGEAAPPPPPPAMRGLTKALLLAGPVVLAIGGIAAWQYMAKPRGAAAMVATPAAARSEPIVTPLAPDPTPAAAPQPTPPSPPPLPPPPPPIVEPAANVAPVAATPTAKAPIAKAPIVRPAPRAPARTPPPRTRTAVTTDEPPPALEATIVPKAEPVPTPAPTPAPPPVVAPAPAPAPPAPPSVVAEPTMTMLSTATVSLVAGDHAGQLAKCEGSSTLHGDVAISFEINAAGKVTKSQVSSTIKNVKVAACILTAVRSWQFPKPPSGAAKGVYTITYQ